MKEEGHIIICLKKECGGVGYLLTGKNKSPAIELGAREAIAAEPQKNTG